MEDWIEEKLEELGFVEWDRYFGFEDDEHGEILTVYGWIEREKDSYKDFVLVKVFKKYEDITLEATSSAKYSEEIYETLYGDTEDHIECARVENRFEIKNAVNLE